MVKGRKIGHIVTLETRMKISKIMKGKLPWNTGTKGLIIPWNKGKKGLQIAWNKNKKLPQFSEEKAYQWKGDKVGYIALHIWVAEKLGKSDICDFCGTSGLKGRQIHWANKSHQYKRDINDWIRLCASCHRYYDQGFETARKEKYHDNYNVIY